MRLVYIAVTSLAIASCAAAGPGASPAHAPLIPPPVTDEPATAPEEALGAEQEDTAGSAQTASDRQTQAVSPTAAPADTQKTQPVEQAPSVQEDGADAKASEPSSEGPPLFLIEENMDTTHFSGVIRIDEVEVREEGTKEHGYVNHRYRATVLKTRVGRA